MNPQTKVLKTDFIENFYHMRHSRSGLRGCCRPRTCSCQTEYSQVPAFSRPCAIPANEKVNWQTYRLISKCCLKRPSSLQNLRPVRSLSVPNLPSGLQAKRSLDSVSPWQTGEAPVRYRNGKDLLVQFSLSKLLSAGVMLLLKAGFGGEDTKCRSPA